MKNWLKSSKGKKFIVIFIVLTILIGGIVAYFIFSKKSDEELSIPLGIYRKTYNPRNIANQVVIVDAKNCVLTKNLGNDYERLSITSKCTYKVDENIITFKYVLNNLSAGLESERCTLKEGFINCSWNFGVDFKLDKTFD